MECYVVHVISKAASITLDDGIEIVSFKSPLYGIP